MPEEPRPAIVVVDDEPAVLAAVARALRRRLRRALPDPACRIGARGAGAAARGAGPRRPGRAADRRPAHAGHGRHRVPGRGPDLLPRRQAGAADRLRRHRGRDRRHQRGRARLLPPQAVGPARGGAVPRRRGPARDVAGRRGPRVRRGARHRPPLLEGVARGARDFLARNRVLARWIDVERDAEAREWLEVFDIDADRLPVALLEDGIRAWNGRRCLEPGEPWASAPSPSRSTTTWSSSAAGRPGWPRRSTVPPRGCAR